jgi:hypothetical protein
MSNFIQNYKVTCDFLGRLGNNLFQAAAVVGYAEKYGVDYALPLGYHHHNIYRFFPKFKYQHVRERGQGLGAFGNKKYEEQECKYTDIPFNPSGTHLRGFFQSERYFEHCKDKILELLNFRYEPSDFVSIHVRRGDYLEYNKNFTTATESFLNDAMSRFQGEKFLVFSDDLPWCKETFPTTYQGKHFEFQPNGLTDFDKLSLMSSCEHNIIGASSFSWWGAWANRNPDKIVISPSKETWFGVNAQQLETKYLIPESWIQIHTR